VNSAAIGQSMTDGEPLKVSSESEERQEQALRSVQ
jgi:hypothetical protein